MRTTIDIDDALLKRLRDDAHKEGVPFRTMLHRVIHRGLADPDQGPEPPYVVPSRRLGQVREGINLVKALQLAGELEDEEIVRKMRRDEKRFGSGKHVG